MHKSADLLREIEIGEAKGRLDLFLGLEPDRVGCAELIVGIDHSYLECHNWRCLTRALEQCYNGTQQPAKKQSAMSNRNRQMYKSNSNLW